MAAPSTDETPPRTRTCAALVAAAAVLPYVATLDGRFLNWDDTEYVTLNEELRLPLGEAVVRIFTTFHIGNWNPLQRLSYLAEWKLFGPEPFAFRLTNVLLHAGCALLAFAVLDTWLRGRLRSAWTSRWTAAAAATLFAAHPSNVETVAWISERKSLLAAAFAFGAAWMWLRAEPGDVRRRAGALALFGIGLLAKTSIVVLPALLVLLDLSRRRRPAWGWMFGFAAVAAGPAWMQVAAAERAIQPLHGGSVGTHAATIVAAIPDYAAQVVLPLRHAPRRLFEPVTSAGDLRLWCGLALLAALAATVLRSWRGAGVWFVAVPWALCVLLLTLIVPIPIIVADRYLYLLLPFVLAAIVASLEAFRARRSPPASPRAKTWTAAAAVVACTLLAAEYGRAWRTSESLWERQLSRHPGDAMAWYSMGTTQMESGRPAACRVAYEQVLRIDPERKTPHGRAAADGILWLDLAEGRAADVESAAAARVAADRTDAPAWSLLATAQEMLGRIDDASATWSRAREACPADPDLAANAAEFRRRHPNR